MFKRINLFKKRKKIRTQVPIQSKTKKKVLQQDEMFIQKKFTCVNFFKYEFTSSYAFPVPYVKLEIFVKYMPSYNHAGDF